MTNDTINEIIKNGGATLDRNLKSIKAKSGYMVSLQGYEKTFNINNINYETVSDTIKEYQKTVSRNNNYYIGLWVDNGLLYIDISKHFINKKEALKEGRKNKQLAIFDLKTFESIYLKNTTTVYTIYTEDMQLITQFDTMEEVAKYCNTTYNAIKMAKNKDVLINGMYFVFSDTFNTNEIA